MQRTVRLRYLLLLLLLVFLTPSARAEIELLNESVKNKRYSLTAEWLYRKAHGSESLKEEATQSEILNLTTELKEVLPTFLSAKGEATFLREDPDPLTMNNSIDLTRLELGPATLYVFTVGWGDCFAGCIHNHRFYVESTFVDSQFVTKLIASTGDEIPKEEIAYQSLFLNLKN